MDQQEKLFEEFSPVSAEDWKEKLQADLKGKTFEDLATEQDGISIEPFYTAENFEPLEIPSERQTEGWQIRQDFFANDPKATNQQILNALKNGADAIGLHFRSEQEVDNIPKLLDGVNPEFISIHFVADELCEKVLYTFTNWAKENSFSPDKLSGSFNYDPFCQNESPDFEATATFIEKVKSALTYFKALTIHANGETAIDQVRYTSKTLENFSQQLTTHNSQLAFSIPISPNYFFEIAKLRALRWLWNDWQIKSGIPSPIPAFIQAHKSWQTNDESDPYHNILMHTTEAMSAIIGGCDILNLRSTDQTDQLDNAFFERISRNTQLLLKHEAHFDKVTDPAKGSYYVEALTKNFIDNLSKD